MEEEKKPGLPDRKRGVARKFPVSIELTLTEEGNDYSIEFFVKRPKTEHLVKALGGEFQWEAVVTLGTEVITDIREGDIIFEGEPLTNKVKDWKDILIEYYPDLVMYVGREYYYLIMGQRVMPEAINLDFSSSQRSPT